VKLPFGQIFTIEEGIKQSQMKPFNPNWFVFLEKIGIFHSGFALSLKMKKV